MYVCMCCFHGYSFIIFSFLFFFLSFIGFAFACLCVVLSCLFRLCIFLFLCMRIFPLFYSFFVYFRPFFYTFLLSVFADFSLCLFYSLFCILLSFLCKSVLS